MFPLKPSSILMSLFVFVLQTIVAEVCVVALPKRFQFQIARGFLYFAAHEYYWIITTQLTCFICLTVCLIQIPVLILPVFFKDAPFNKSATTSEMTVVVARWKQHYFLICHLVADMNDFLGHSMLLLIGFTFFTCVTFTSSFISEITHEQSIPFEMFLECIFTILQMVVSMISLVYISEEIPKQVCYHSVYVGNNSIRCRFGLPIGYKDRQSTEKHQPPSHWRSNQGEHQWSNH